MSSIFDDIQDAIDDILNETTKEYSPSEDVHADVVIQIFIKLIPSIRENILIYSIEKVLHRLSEYRQNHIQSFNKLIDAKLHTEDESDVYVFSQSMDDRFYHGTLVKVSQLIIDAIKSSQNGLNNQPLDTNSLPGRTDGRRQKTFEKSLSVRQIALLYVYNGDQITKENAEEIAKFHGHKSGKHLLSKYGKYISTANRKGRPHPFTTLTLKNKIKLFESVIELLPEDKTGKAIDDLRILESYKDELE